MEEEEEEEDNLLLFFSLEIVLPVLCHSPPLYHPFRYLSRLPRPRLFLVSLVVHFLALVLVFLTIFLVIL